MAEEPAYPVEDIQWIMYACRADEPLQPGSQLRHDFSNLRGRRVLDELASTLLQQLGSRFHHRILCGHRGSGKSTELLALKEWADENGFLTVWMEVDLYFGLAELHFSDMYLLAAEAVERAMKECNAPLPSDKLKSVVKWFAEVILEDKNFTHSELAAEAGAQLGGTVPFSLGSLFAKFTSSIKGSSEHHRNIRRTLRQSPETLIDLTNKLLQEANARLQDCNRPKGLLLLFDNLDRYEAENIKGLLLDGANLMLKMDAHTIFTMPINLHQNPTSPIWDDYGLPTVLPMLALRKATDGWKPTVQLSPYTEDAVKEMRDALSRRLKIETLFENSDDALLLVKMSGGCIRDLLHLVGITVQRSFRLGQTITQLTSEGVRLAINQYRGDLAQGLTPAQFTRLASIARREPKAETLDEEALKLLALRILLRYTDQNEQRWLDVHPLVIETEGFQRAFADAATIETH